MQSLEIPAADKIHLLVGGITQAPMRATALALRAETVEQFIEQMRHISEEMTEAEKKTASGSGVKIDGKGCFKCGKTGHTQAECRGQLTCFYCKETGHRSFDCPKKATRRPPRTAAGASTTATAAVTEGEEDDQVAAVVEGREQIVVRNPVVRVQAVNGKSVELRALIDTGSPVSFIRANAFENLPNRPNLAIAKSARELRNLSREILKVIGIVNVEITLEPINQTTFSVELHVLKDTVFESDLILGREFLKQHKLTLVYDPTEEIDRVNLLTHLPLCIEDELGGKNLKQVLDEHEIDFGVEDRQKLIETIVEVEGEKIEPVNDGHSVEVRLKDPSVYAYAPRRFAYGERVQIRAITDDLLKRGIIKVSTSPYCARVIPVRKKSGKIRLCVDLRPLNSRIIKQKYPFPVIEECLARLGNKAVFTLLDLKDSFHQISVNENSTKYFAFATPDGQFEYTKLPFGFSESPAEFQKRIIQILSPLIREDKIIVYIDDVLIPSNTVEENLKTLKEVLILLKKYNFALNLQKCQFLKKRIEFLGYIISAEGITLSARHTDAINDYKPPRNVHEVHKFLGLASYFRRFIKDYALKAKPLQNLLRKSTGFRFDESCAESFRTLKKELTAYPVLRLYDPAAETEIHTDACSTGLGGILVQKQEDSAWMPVAYYSQATSETESRYHSFELEMLVIVKTIERLHLYLYGIDFTIVTDCNALVHAVNKANLNPRIARWTLILQNYSFKITHRPGKRMAHVDALSRSVAYVNELPLERELEFRQLADPRIKEICDKLEVEDSDRFTLTNGLLYRKVGDTLKFVIPESTVTSVLRAHHDEMAHCGAEKTLKSIEENFWFPGMRKKVYEYLENCLPCVMANSAVNRFEGETHLAELPKKPLEVLYLDHFGPLQEAENKFKYILVIIDVYTRFTWLFATKSTGAKETANALNTVINTFGTPTEIVSDRGTAFTGKDFADFASERGIKHRKVAVAAPWANGLVERVNRFLKSSLTKLLKQANEWRRELGHMQYILNNTYHSGIKTSPSKLMLGYQQRNHSDFAFAQYTKELAEIDSNLDAERAKARDVALQATDLLRNYNKRYRDEKCKKLSEYNVGDYILIRNRSKPGENKKLSLKYKGPYMIKKDIGNNRYVVTDIPGFNLASKPLDTILSTDRIKRWIKPVHDINCIPSVK